MSICMNCGTELTAFPEPLLDMVKSIFHWCRIELCENCFPSFLMQERRASDGGKVLTFVSPERHREKLDREACDITTLNRRAHDSR